MQKARKYRVSENAKLSVNKMSIESLHQFVDVCYTSKNNLIYQNGFVFFFEKRSLRCPEANK